jgi:hypothetical protein
MSIKAIIEVGLFPFLSMTCPIERDPKTSPTPRHVMEYIAFISFSLISKAPKTLEDTKGTRTPVMTDRLKPDQIN